jgi:hypothetical protein
MKSMMAAMLFGVLAGGVQADEAVKVTPIRLTETRVKSLVKEKSFYTPESELKLLLHVEGKTVNDAVSYGKIEFEQAVDDTGASLKPKKKGGMFSSGSDDDWKAVNEGMAGFGRDEDEPGFRLELELAPAARKATRISRLKGKIPVLAGGEAKTVKADKLKAMMGKTIEDPVLAKAGFKVRVLDPKKKEGSGFFSMGGENSVPIEVKGDLNAIKDMDIVDAKGESLVSSRSWSGSGDTRTYYLDLDKPASDAMTIKIDVVVGLKKLAVPFDFKDLELP